MKVEHLRPNVYRLTLTAPELSALVGAARLTYETLRAERRAPAEAIELLGRVLREYDAGIARHDEDGRPERPS